MNDGNPKPTTAPSDSLDSKSELPTATVEVANSAVDAAGSPSSEAANEGEIEKLQELLFGNQLRAINQKIMLVHKDFKQAISELERKLDAQMKAETGTLKNLYESTSVQMLSSSNDAHDKISILEQAQAGVQVNLEERLNTLNSDIDSKIKLLGEEVQQRIDGAINTSQQNDTYRAALAELLNGISEKVSALEAQPEPIGQAQASYTATVDQPHPVDSMLDDELNDLDDLDDDDIPTLTPNNPPSTD